MKLQKIIKKTLKMICCLPVIISASWVTEYQQGSFEKKSNVIYAMTQVDISKKEYEKLAQKEALGDLATQIYSKVQSQKISKKSLSNDEYNNDFQHNINIVSNIPIYGAKINKEILQKQKYYLLMTLNTKQAAPIYKQEANQIALDIQSIHKQYKTEKNKRLRENLLHLLNKAVTKYEKYSMVARLMGAKDIKQISISSYDVQKEFLKFYEENANEISELAAILAKRLSQSGIKNSIKVLPFSYANKKTYSEFSSNLQNHLEHEMAKKMRVTSKHDSLYTLSGNYYIDEKSLTATARIYDSFGDIIHTAIATLTLKKQKNKSFYTPKTNEYDSMKELKLSDKLSINARMNGLNEGLLFRGGDDIKLEVKVSQESYIYAIANMRTKKDVQIQYLLPLSDSNGKGAYVKHIPYQNTNLWVNLGEFDVVAPYGSEAIQFFASNVNMIDKFPAFKTMDIDGVEFDGVIVDENSAPLLATRSIAGIRGLKRIKKEKLLIKAETLLQYTTVKN